MTTNQVIIDSIDKLGIPVTRWDVGDLYEIGCELNSLEEDQEITQEDIDQVVELHFLN
ncbi:MAG: hypothetical protein ACFFDN_04955 [Candidatus Hodarchaeota archaeon]